VRAAIFLVINYLPECIIVVTSMTTEIITVTANVALTLSFIVALIFGIAQVRAAERDRRERLTVETLHNFQSREFAKLINYVITRDMPANRKELLALPLDEQIAFLQLSQQMESLGILVAEGYIDLDLVDKTLGSFVTSAWAKYKTLILAARITQPSPDPYLAEYFQWLAERIDERLHKNPRPPFYENTFV
jgi:uncharacterized protein with PQ loop repeat